MELRINLNNQRNLRRGKKALIIFSAVYLLLSIITFVSLMYMSSVLIWFYAFYFLFFSISLFIQSKGKHPLDLIGRSYFNVNEIGFGCKLGLFNKKIIEAKWSEIEDIKIKLFKVELKIDDKWVSIDLEKFTDDNLKAVKEAFKKVQSKIADREIFVA